MLNRPAHGWLKGIIHIGEEMIITISRELRMIKILLSVKHIRSEIRQPGSGRAFQSSLAVIDNEIATFYIFDGITLTDQIAAADTDRCMPLRDVRECRGILANEYHRFSSQPF